MLYPTTTEEFESKYGPLDSQPVGSYIVKSADKEADEVEDKEYRSQLPENEIIDEYTPLVRGEE